ncbi:MAG: transcription termination factor Rho [Clostridia bacterium]|nr:transcription termination factor Rho [Clostridia bacterium]
MDYRLLHMKTVAELRQLAKENQVKIPLGTKKAQMVELILEKQQAMEQAEEKKLVSAPAAPASAEPAAVQPKPAARRGRPRKAVAANPEPAGQAEISTEKAEPAAQVSEKPEPMRQVEILPAKAEPAAQAETAAEAHEPSAKPIAEEVPAAEAAPVAEENPASREIRNPAYHRPMSTQQRMGARTHPTMGAARPQTAARMQPARGPHIQDASMQPPRAPRMQDASMQPRPMRGYEAPQRRFQPNPANPVSSPSPINPANPEGQPVRRFAPQQDAPRSFDENRPAAEEYRGAVNPLVPDILASGECGDGAGILEIHADGYGFLRAENYLPGNRDVYVSAAQIRRFNLRTGDYVVGKTRSQQANDRSVGLIYISEVNGQSPDAARNRVPFDALVPIYPNERLRMERDGQNDLSLRLIDLLAPIGKGQRGMIVSPPKAGKTTLLKKIANAITVNNPDVHLIVLLIDERPEEVTDMKRSIQGEVVYSTFDEAPENHTRVSEMVLERAQRLVETGKDVVVLLDSITRLARAYNLVIPPTGRSLSGGLDPGALYRPKRFFGAARNIENGGSLTIIATALVDTGSRMDDIIFEEFKGTGNMELHLDRSLSDRRIFPAIDMFKSGTRREELLLTPAELEGVYQVRRMLSRGNAQEASEQMISLIEKSSSNAEFLMRVKNWSLANKKDGFK